MGAAVSAYEHQEERIGTKKIFVNIQGRIEIIQFPVGSTSTELKELLYSTSGLSSKWTAIVLRNSEGHIIPISPSLPENSLETCYCMETVREKTCDLNADVLSELVSLLRDELVSSISSEIYDSRCSEGWNSSPEGSRSVGNQEHWQNKGNMKTEDSVFFSDLEFPANIVGLKALEQLKTPEFDVWIWDTNKLLILSEHMFKVLGIIEHIEADSLIFRRWLVTVHDSYQEQPFHNFRHAFTVTQMMYSMIHFCELSKVFNKTELAILMMASFCHDVDHPGLNNTYQVNAHTELAVLYNDKSPLENHHCAVSFDITSKPLINIFQSCSDEKFQEIRTGMVELILATDMSRHEEIIETFKKTNKNGLDLSSKGHRNLVMKLLIKCCDVSNEVRPPEIAEPWIDCLLEEYFAQGDKEKQEGLPVAPFMDRNKVTKPIAQIGFIQGTLLPMFKEMAEVTEGNGSVEYIENGLNYGDITWRAQYFDASNSVFPQIEDEMISPLRSALTYYQNQKLMEEKKSGIMV